MHLLVPVICSTKIYIYIKITDCKTYVFRLKKMEEWNKKNNFDHNIHCKKTPILLYPAISIFAVQLKYTDKPV